VENRLEFLDEICFIFFYSMLFYGIFCGWVETQKQESTSGGVIEAKLVVSNFTEQTL